MTAAITFDQKTTTKTSKSYLQLYLVVNICDTMRGSAVCTIGREKTQNKRKIWDSAKIPQTPLYLPFGIAKSKHPSSLFFCRCLGVFNWCNWCCYSNPKVLGVWLTSPPTRTKFQIRLNFFGGRFSSAPCCRMLKN